MERDRVHELVLHLQRLSLASGLDPPGCKATLPEGLTASVLGRGKHVSNFSHHRSPSHIIQILALTDVGFFGLHATPRKRVRDAGLKIEPTFGCHSVCSWLSEASGRLIVATRIVACEKNGRDRMGTLRSDLYAQARTSPQAPSLHHGWQ